MAWTCITETGGIEDIRQDRRKAEHVEKYMISEKAVYFEGKYLPISRIRNARIQPSFYYPNHSCGKGIPVFKIRLDYGEERPLVLMVERKNSADRIVDKICAANLITSPLITSP